jgi:hypothetical protein
MSGVENLGVSMTSFASISYYRNSFTFFLLRFNFFFNAC